MAKMSLENARDFERDLAPAALGTGGGEAPQMSEGCPAEQTFWEPARGPVAIL